MRQFGIAARGLRVSPGYRPQASVDAYQAWLDDNRFPQGRGPRPFTANELRRVVMLRRAGDNFNVIATALGRSYGGLKGIWAQLPDHLK